MTIILATIPQAPSLREGAFRIKPRLVIPTITICIRHCSQNVVKLGGFGGIRRNWRKRTECSK